MTSEILSTEVRLSQLHMISARGDAVHPELATCLASVSLVSFVKVLFNVRRLMFSNGELQTGMKVQSSSISFNVTSVAVIL